MQIFLVFIFILIFIVWVVVTQPTFTFQTDKHETTYIKSKNLKKQVYKIVKQFRVWV